MRPNFIVCSPPSQGRAGRTQGVRGSGWDALKGAGLSGRPGVRTAPVGRGCGRRSRGPCGEAGLTEWLGAAYPVPGVCGWLSHSRSCLTDAQPLCRAAPVRGCKGRAWLLRAPGGPGPASFYPEGVQADSWLPKGLLVYPGDQRRQGGKGWGPRVTVNAGPLAQTPPSLQVPQSRACGAHSAEGGERPHVKVGAGRRECIPPPHSAPGPLPTPSLRLGTPQLGNNQCC